MGYKRRERKVFSIWYLVFSEENIKRVASCKLQGARCIFRKDPDTVSGNIRTSRINK